MLPTQVIHLPVLLLQTGVVVAVPRFVMQSVVAAHTKHLPGFEPAEAQFKFVGQPALDVQEHIFDVHV